MNLSMYEMSQMMAPAEPGQTQQLVYGQMKSFGLSDLPSTINDSSGFSVEGHIKNINVESKILLLNRNMCVHGHTVHVTFLDPKALENFVSFDV